MAEILQGRTMDELRRQAGILGERVKNNAKAARAIVNSSFHNAGFSDRIWAYQDLLRNELSSLLQSGLIQGKNPRTLARELRKTFDAGISNTERLMRTELARVQTEAQKESFLRNGFTEYTFVVNGRCCDICKALDGKHFKVEDMEPGENAPPMHPNCRCSTAAWEDSDEYEAWLDFLSKGGTTAEWNRLKENHAVANGAKKMVEINGKKVIIDNDTFDPGLVDRQGRTNLQRMEQGLAPIGTDGKSVNIHHIDQTDTGPVIEITATNHQQNYAELHINTGQSASQIDRDAFNKWRREYWKWRRNNLE